MTPVSLAASGVSTRRASLPLDRRGRLAADVIGHAGDATDLVDDAVRNLLQQLVRQVGPAGGHEVDGLDGAKGDDPLVTAAVADHADRFHRQEDGKGLAGLVVPVGVVQFLDEDGVGFAQDVGVLLLHFAEDAHAEAGPREGMTVDHVVGQAEFKAELAHFVLEQFAQRFDQLELHGLGQAADVVVRLDHVGLAGLAGGGFDHVRVDGALG